MRGVHQFRINKLFYLVLFIVGISLTSCGARKQVQQGEASYYHNKFRGKKTASGERFRQYKLTAAHRTLPFGTKVKVTNLRNGKSVRVKINDRGPFVDGRIIDLSRKAARRIDLLNSGVAPVKIEYKVKRK
ncbi:MAG TPA: septal ring lytic transglycosylase RlpA family protein [Flavobacteriaceae bacterium]|nr:septal ring lytic transglycosylase RlpA family protein [Flavobacteriaceae bacterium]